MLCAIGLRAQSVSMAVISPTGGYFLNANISVAHTTAEMSMVQTFTTSSIVLTQGFHQPEAPITVSVADFAVNGFASLRLYPNPATDFCQLNFELHGAAEVSIHVLNAMGQVVHTATSAPFAAGNYTHTLPLDACAAGFYVVRVQLSGSHGKTHFQNLPLQVIR